MAAEGRVARTLRSLLAVEGYAVSHFFPAQGAWRSDVRLDCYRWTAIATKDGYTTPLESWYTMTELIRAGVVHVDGTEVFPGPRKT